MSELDLLKILPKEQFTEYKGTCIQIRDLIKILEKQNEKNNNEHWIPFSERTEITGVIVVPKDRKGWQPTTVPKPVYTTAAKAVPSKRIIDLTSTGEWSAEQERIKALSGRDDDLFDQSLLTDGIEEDRAVNE